MSKRDKLLVKLLNLNGSLTWLELESLLKGLGFRHVSGAGSRVKFFHPALETVISLHRPHPGNEVKRYARRHVNTVLQEGGYI
jgi:predicted RNA binding protein YcfA (HicA-like mRNA interferase family)